MTEDRVQVTITKQPLDIGAAFAFVSDPSHGAISTFVGAVRDYNLGRTVTGVSYDSFEPLALSFIKKICVEISSTYGGRIYISHFIGRLEVGEKAVVIAVSTPHRDEAFKACRQIIEDLKHKVPIWKQEHYTDGSSEWVKGHALCSHG
jgi:molybdopterin synthase catalytic subunit